MLEAEEECPGILKILQRSHQRYGEEGMVREKLTVDVLLRSWLECCRREFGGVERIFCSRRDSARLKSIASISFDFVLSDSVGAMIYSRKGTDSIHSRSMTLKRFGSDRIRSDRIGSCRSQAG